MTIVGFTRTQYSRRPFRFVRSIGILLSLQTDRSTLIVSNTFLSGQRTIKEVSGIYLNSRFIGIYIQYNTCFLRFQ